MQTTTPRTREPVTIELRVSATLPPGMTKREAMRRLKATLGRTPLWCNAIGIGFYPYPKKVKVQAICPSK